jgi:hypothetical protein
LGQVLQTSLHNYVIRFRRARAAGTELTVPSVAELLTDPAFAPLKQWLSQRQVPVDEVQSAVAELVAELGAKGPGDMGRVMAVAKSRLGASAEMAQVSAAVKAALSR